MCQDWRMSTASRASEPFFTRADGALLPMPSTEGGWNPGTLMGRHLAGLVAHGAERHGQPDLQPSRLTVDMFRPAPMGPTSLPTRVVRDGRRIRVVDVDVVVGGSVVCRGTVVFLRRSSDPSGVPWRPAERELPDPESSVPMQFATWTPTWDQRPHAGRAGDDTSLRGSWIREDRSFIDGEETTPFVRAALAADNANGIINSTTIGLPYINADLTITMARLPIGEWVGLTAVSRAIDSGVSTGVVDLYDRTGRFGQVTMIALADERNLRTAK